MLYKKINEEEFASFGGKPDLTIWQVATEQEKTDYNNDLPLKKAKKAKCIEILNLRDKKILEDSARKAEAEAGDATVMALNNITDVNNFDINSVFS